MKNKQLLIIGEYEPCKYCKKLMQRRKHSFLTEKQLKHKHYFTEWDYCKPCKFVQHYEKFKKEVSKSNLNTSNTY